MGLISNPFIGLHCSDSSLQNLEFKRAILKVVFIMRFSLYFALFSGKRAISRNQKILDLGNNRFRLGYRHKQAGLFEF